MVKGKERVGEKRTKSIVNCCNVKNFKVVWLVTRKMRERKWILRNCGSLKFLL